MFLDDGRPAGDFRKAWRSACKRAGVPEKAAMQISGHKTRSVFDRYNIVSERDLVEATTKMEQRFQTAISTLLTHQQESADTPLASNLLN